MNSTGGFGTIHNPIPGRPDNYSLSIGLKKKKR